MTVDHDKPAAAYVTKTNLKAAFRTWFKRLQDDPDSIPVDHCEYTFAGQAADFLLHLLAEPDDDGE